MPYDDSTDFEDFIQGVNALTVGYRLVQTLYFTSTDDFVKATYPWLRAVKAKVQAAGGSGAGAEATNVDQISGGSGGTAGAYAEKFILASELLATETVTVGEGGAGVTGAAGNPGENSSFGAHVSANGGPAGVLRTATTPPRIALTAAAQATGTGDLVIPGAPGVPPIHLGTGASQNMGGKGGDSHLGAGGRGRVDTNGDAGAGYGAAGGGAANSASEASTRAGGDGVDGIVIVELYA